MHKYYVLADFRVYLNTFLLKFYIHHKLNMLGLVLTTTSLPPPVWTHNHCLFKLVLRHFFSANWHYQNCFLWCRIKSDSSADFSSFNRAVVASLFIDYIVPFSSFLGGDLHMKSRIRSIAIFFVLSLWFTVNCNFCALWYSLFCFILLLEQLLLILFFNSFIGSVSYRSLTPIVLFQGIPA